MSGAPITASYKGVDAVDLQSRAKWWMSINDFMDIRDTSFAFERRIVPIPFTHKFTGNDAEGW